VTRPGRTGGVVASEPAPDQAPLVGSRSSAGGATGGEFPGLSNHNSGAVAMRMGPCPMQPSG